MTRDVFGGLGHAPTMPLDAVRHGDEVVIRIDLPGVDPDSVDLTVEKNVLKVAADRARSTAEGDEVIVTERPLGHFSRQLFLGESLDSDKVSATYEAGVLTVRVPVRETAKPRRVEISDSRDSAAIDTGSAAA